MANLTATESLLFPVDRQDLFNLWSTAVLGTFPKSQLAPSVTLMDIGTALSDATTSPVPGHHFFSKLEGLVYVFHDEVDNTGVSLWLATGPDRFDVAALARRPVPAGAVLQPWHDRWVDLATGASTKIFHQRAIGTSAAKLDISNILNTGVAFGGTQDSGTWIPMSVDGVVYAYTFESILANRWVRVVDGSDGRCEENENSGQPQPRFDDSLGMGVFTLNGSTTTPLRFQFIWSGPRVINNL